MRSRIILLIFLLWPALARTAAAGEGVWQSVKGKHFVVYYQDEIGKPQARTVLRRAEDYYQTIGARIGYTRYTDFWTWDERVRILLFPDRETFTATTGQPQWSLGYADRDSRMFRSRTIVTYPQEQDFLDGVLPHEISHLILSDYIPDRSRVPLWFEEGVAQMEEAGKGARAEQRMRSLVGQGQYIHFDFFMRWDIRYESDPVKVEIFYAQSVVIVNFLIKKYGNDAFERLCRHLREGLIFEDALRKATSSRISSIADFEKQWLAEFGP